MKRLFLILLTIALLPLGVNAGAASQKVTSSRVRSLVSEVSDAEGANVVRMGSLATSLMKRVIAGSIDRSVPEEAALLDIIKGIKQFTVIEYGDCADDVKDRIVRKFKKILPDEDILMDIKSDGQTMRMYGVVSEDGSMLKDFIMHAPESSALICMFGSIPISGITTLIEEQ